MSIRHVPIVVRGLRGSRWWRCTGDRCDIFKAHWDSMRDRKAFKAAKERERLSRDPKP